MKKILLISNMYPSKKYPHYGIFVKHAKSILEDAGYSVDLSVIIKEDKKIKKAISYILFYFRTFVKCLRKYDFIYAHYASHVAFPILLAHKFNKIPIVLNVHGNDVVPEDSKDEKYSKLVHKLVVESEKIICPSDYFIGIMRKNYSVPDNKLFVYPSGGVDTSFFINIDKIKAQKKLGLDTSFRYIGYVSRIEICKGWDIFLKACSKIMKYDPDIRLIVVGSGDQNEEYLKLVDELAIGDKIIKYNLLSQKELRYIYNSMDVFVFPTYRKSESLGLVGLEAMSCGTITVLPDRYGPSSYGKNKFNSLIFNLKNVNSLYNTIIQALQLDEASIQTIKNGARLTALKYDKNCTKDVLISIFELEHN